MIVEYLANKRSRGLVRGAYATIRYAQVKMPVRFVISVLAMLPNCNEDLTVLPSVPSTSATRERKVFFEMLYEGLYCLIAARVDFFGDPRGARLTHKSDKIETVLGRLIVKVQPAA